MKTTNYFLIALLIFTSTLALAQDTPQNMDYLKMAEKYRKMKNAGGALTIVGGLLFVAGRITMVSSSDGIFYTEDQSQYETGAIMTVIGIAGLAPGIPLWAVGAHQEKKYRQKQGGLHVRLDANVRTTGLTLSYRFR